MTDPVPPRIRRPPRRAPPLQPDQPWRGQGADPAGAPDASSDTASDTAPAADSTTGTPQDAESVKRQKEQAEAALQNVREGYDR